MTELLADCDHFIAGAAMIGGISYFHTYAYDLLTTNERIIAASCDAAIAAQRDGRLRKVTYLSSSMVFESADEWPSYEGQQREIPPQLAELIWRKVMGEGVPLRLAHDDPFEYDVQRRVPDTEKAKKMLGFEATTTLDQMLDEVIPWIDSAIKAGTV